MGLLNRPTWAAQLLWQISEQSHLKRKEQKYFEENLLWQCVLMKLAPLSKINYKA
jgi:hypothetical protein